MNCGTSCQGNDAKDSGFAIVAGFGLSVPFMDSSIYVGPVASGPLKG